MLKVYFISRLCKKSAKNMKNRSGGGRGVKGGLKLLGKSICLCKFVTCTGDQVAETQIPSLFKL